MKHRWSWTILAVFIMASFALQCMKPAPDTREADKAAIRAINPSWFKSYNARDVSAIVGLYADDAVLNPPGVPAARGQAAIREYLTKDIAAATAAGMNNNGTGTTDVGVSGDLGWEWGSYTVTDKSGATIEKGKYVTVYERKGGKWFIIRDIWNSDGPMQPMGTN